MTLPSVAEMLSRRIERAKSEAELDEAENLIRRSRGLTVSEVLAMTIAANRKRKELTR